MTALAELERWSRTVRGAGTSEQAALIDTALESLRRGEKNHAVAAELLAWSMMEEPRGSPYTAFAAALRDAAAALTD